MSLGEPDTNETGVVKCEKVNVGCRLPTGEIQYETREREKPSLRQPDLDSELFWAGNCEGTHEGHGQWVE